ncbi:MAG TPA: hypothetical protein VIP11_21700 [Gemmatimonadaceae bacterium]
MLFSVRANTVSLGVVDLPAGLLVAGQLEPSPQYATVAEVVRQATDAFLHLGLFDAVAPLLPPIPADTRRLRRALTRAARLQIALIGVNGEQVSANFVNLLEAPADQRVIVLASFAIAPTSVGASRSVTPTSLGSVALPHNDR